MSLVINALTVSWGITGINLCQISDCSVRLNQGLLPAYSTNVNFGYMGMWHVAQKLIQLVGLSLKGITRNRGRPQSL